MTIKRVGSLCLLAEESMFNYDQKVKYVMYDSLASTCVQVSSNLVA